MIHAEGLRQAGIDYEAGLKRFLGDPELYEAVLTAFAGEDVLERAQAAFERGDRDQLLRAAHEAKGSGGNAGLDAVYADAAALVTLLRRPDAPDSELTEHYQRFATTYRETRDAIRAALR